MALWPPPAVRQDGPFVECRAASEKLGIRTHVTPSCGARQAECCLELELGSTKVKEGGTLLAIEEAHQRDS